MSKVTTKLRKLGRLLGWVSLSFGMAIATSQTASAWLAVNYIANDVEFLNCAVIDCRLLDKGGRFDGMMRLGHIVSCGQNEARCGNSQGMDMHVAIVDPIYPKFRLLYPSVYIPPHGIVQFSGGQYTTSLDEYQPSAEVVSMPSPRCQTYYNGYWYFQSFREEYFYRNHPRLRNCAGLLDRYPTP